MMTRSIIEDRKHGARSWEGDAAVPIDGGKMETNDASRPKGRIRRSMTACNTCRKLKTRCDLDPRSHACRRCLSLRIDCQLPETGEKFQDNSPIWSDATSAVPSIEERLISLERSMGDMTHMMRQMMDRSPSISSTSTPQLARSVTTDDTASIDGASPILLVPKPVHQIQELQSEFFGEMDGFSDGSSMSDIVSRGIIDPKLSLKLIQIFVEQFGSWVSIESLSDFQNEASQTDPLLYSTACLLASRYVSGISPHAIQAMCLQVRHAATNILWNTPPLSYKSLQALTALCLWQPTIQKGALMDGWLLSGISINHALISFEFLGLAPSDYIIDNDIVRKLRLWNTLCLTQLHFAIGNARPFNIQQKYLDHCPRVLEHPNATLEDAKAVAEIQLYLITLKIQKNIQRLQYAEAEYEEIERWKMEWSHVFTNDHHSTLSLNLWFCHLLLNLTTTKLHPGAGKIPEILHNARLILTKLLQTRFSVALGFIDQIYFIVGYAALTLCDLNVTDPLIDRVQAFLWHVSLDEEHIAYRFSCIIAELKRRYTQDPFRGGTGTGASLDLNLSKMVEGEGGRGFTPVMDGVSELKQIIPEFYAFPGVFQDGNMAGMAGIM